MSGRDFAARPAVLRCGRCGRFAGWTEAQLQIVCGCRPHLPLPPVLVHDASAADRRAALDLFVREFGRLDVLIEGIPAGSDEIPLLVAEGEGGVTGALAWRETGDGVHIVAMATDPMWQRSGVGGSLLAEVERLARRRLPPRLIVTVTNDNIPALYFYQRRGYRVSAVVPRPAAAPAAGGFSGIPIRDDIRLTKDLP